MTERHDMQPYAPAHGSRVPAPPEAAHAHGHGGASRSEEDRIHTSRIVWVGAGALLVFILASVATTLYFEGKLAERPRLPVPPEVGQSKIGMVEQQMFELAVRGETDRKGQLDKLRSYGWVDREKGVAHIPIERAMELAAKGVRAPSEPATAAAPAPGGAL